MKSLLFKGIALLGFAFFLYSCNDDDATLPQVEAGFTQTINQDNGVVSFLNTSSDNSDSFEWDFGDGTTSTEFEPTKVYETGQYIVELTASNVAGASDTFTDTIMINIPLPVSVPFNFDEANVVYEPTTFNGASFSIVENPDQTGSNTSTGNVGQISNSGNAFEGLFFNLGTPLDLSSDMTIVMDVWSNVAIPVLLKLENGTGPDVELARDHTGTGWEEMIFTFDSMNSYSTFTLFFDGPGTTMGNFYIDNVQQSATVDIIPPVITLNGDAMVTVIVGGTFTDPGFTAIDNPGGTDLTSDVVVGGDAVDTNTIGTYTITYNVMDAAGNAAAEVTRVVEVIPVPTEPVMSAPTPTQPAANVISVYSDAYTDIPVDGYNFYGGANFQEFEITAGDMALNYETAGNAFQVVEFGGANQQDLLAAGITHFHIDLWFPTIDAGDSFLIKVVDILGGQPVEEALLTIDAASTPALTSGQWLSYDFTLQQLIDAGLGRQENIQQIVFDLINTGEVFIDNVYFWGTGSGGSTGCPSGVYTAATAFPVDFEACETFPSDLNFGSMLTSEVVANPDQGGINTSDFVLQVDKPTGAEFFGGVQNNFPTNFDLSNPSHEFKMKIWSHKANAVFRFEVAQDDPGVGNPPAQFVTVPNANEWTEVSFTFTGMPAPTSYFRLVIKPDNDMADSPITNGGTYYFDDIELIE